LATYLQHIGFKINPRPGFVKKLERPKNTDPGKPAWKIERLVFPGFIRKILRSLFSVQISFPGDGRDASRLSLKAIY